MNRSRLFANSSIGMLVLCLLATGAHADIAVFPGIPGTYVPFDPCGGVTPGGTWLEDMWYLPPDPIAYDWVIEAFEWQFSGEDIYTADGTEYRPEDERWSFSWGDPLNGTLWIDKYEAYDRHHDIDDDGKIVWDDNGPYCRHGAHLSASYDRDPNDPVYLDWAQVFIASYDKHGVPAGTPIADPFYNDGTDDAPFYFSNLDDPLDFYEGGQPGADLIFGDTPGASHLETEPFWVSLSLSLFLTEVDPMDPYHVILYDGISWGYEGWCVPEPASLFLLVVGGLLVGRRRR